MSILNLHVICAKCGNSNHKRPFTMGFDFSIEEMGCDEHGNDMPFDFKNIEHSVMGTWTPTLGLSCSNIVVLYTHGHGIPSHVFAEDCTSIFVSDYGQQTFTISDNYNDFLGKQVLNPVGAVAKLQAITYSVGVGVSEMSIAFGGDASSFVIISGCIQVITSATPVSITFNNLPEGLWSAGAYPATNNLETALGTRVAGSVEVALSGTNNTTATITFMAGPARTIYFSVLLSKVFKEL